VILNTTLRAAVVTVALVLGSATLTAPAVGAAPAASACVPLATPEFDGTLAALTDATGIDTFEQARDRIAALRGELTHSDDYRGTFPLAFDEILSLVGPSIDSGVYDDPVWAGDLAVEVVRLYLTDLHKFVTGGTPSPHWAAALALTEDCDRSPGRVVTGAIFAHLIIDFPKALVNIGTTADNTKDFYTFGGALVDATPGIVSGFEKTYGTDLEGLFTGWFVGDIFGDELATTLMFQSVRTVALVNSFGLQNPATHDATVGEMNLLLGTANLALDGREVTGLI
jgi:hypothetical protein